MTCNVAEYETLATGLNVTLIVQLLPADRVPPQLELGTSVKFDTFVPVAEMLIFDSVVAPVLLSVTDFAPLLTETD